MVCVGFHCAESLLFGFNIRKYVFWALFLIKPYQFFMILMELESLCEGFLIEKVKDAPITHLPHCLKSQKSTLKS